MSTRLERQTWQDFRDSHGATTKVFRQKWRAMFNREPTAEEVRSYQHTRQQLTTPLGQKAKSDVSETVVTVTRRYEWDMGHRLPAHEGKCRRLHGHRYVAEIDVTGPLAQGGSSAGMVLDFGDLDTIVNGVIGVWDHRTMLQDTDACLWVEAKSLLYDASLGIIRVPFVPTAEHIAREIQRLVQTLIAAPATVSRVRVYETPRSWAEVR